MTTTEKLLAELQSRTHLSTYQLELVRQYMEWMYVVGYEQSRVDIGKQTSVCQIKDGKIINTFPNMAAAARSVHGDKSNVRKAVIGKYKTYKGFQWKIERQST
jgi:hypothetical protein